MFLSGHWSQLTDLEPTENVFHFQTGGKKPPKKQEVNMKHPKYLPMSMSMGCRLQSLIAKEIDIKFDDFH